VSLADKLHNARSILTDYRTHGDALWARFGQGQGLATRVYYRELAAAFERERGRMGEHAAPAIDELRRVVDAITALAEERQGPDARVTFDWG
jgi:GTP pyrophosphokinase